jgi:hypothetical protein
MGPNQDLSEKRRIDLEHNERLASMRIASPVAFEPGLKRYPSF